MDGLNIWKKSTNICGWGWGLTRTVSSSNFKIASRTGNESRLPNSMIAVLDHQGFTLKRADIWDSRNSAHDFCRDLSRLPRTPRVRSAPHRWVDPVHSQCPSLGRRKDRLNIVMSTYARSSYEPWILDDF